MARRPSNTDRKSRQDSRQPGKRSIAFSEADLEALLFRASGNRLPGGKSILALFYKNELPRKIIGVFDSEVSRKDCAFVALDNASHNSILIRTGSITHYPGITELKKTSKSRKEFSFGFWRIHIKNKSKNRTIEVSSSDFLENLETKLRRKSEPKTPEQNHLKSERRPGRAPEYVDPVEIPRSIPGFELQIAFERINKSIHARHVSEQASLNLRILALANAAPGITPAQIKSKLNPHKVGLSKALGELVDAGLICKSHEGRSRHVAYLFPTAAGTKLAKALIRREAAIFKKLERSWDADRVQRFRTDLEDFRELLD